MGHPLALKNAPLQTPVKLSGMSRRALIDLRAGRTRPHRKNQELLKLKTQELLLAGMQQ
jgi:hypothetical protein